ncbi:MAG TPA: zinc-binding dehydrogenase [Microvirga sp.]|nr:zinc-binding dehydrogenase [Microvirga sp.]
MSIAAVRQFGADAVIDTSRQSLWKEVERLCPDGCDLVFDANGPETLEQSYAHHRPAGKLMVYGFHMLLPEQGGRIRYLEAVLGLLGARPEYRGSGLSSTLAARRAAPWRPSGRAYRTPR